MRALSVTKNGTAAPTIYAAGAFTSVGADTTYKGAAAFSFGGTPTAWKPDLQTGVDGVRAMVLDGSHAWLPLSDSAIGAFKLSDGSVDGFVRAAGNAVSSLAIVGDTLYAAGPLSSIANDVGVPARRSGLGAWSITSKAPTDWAPLVARAGGQALGRIVLAVSGGQVLVGGGFDLTATARRFGAAAVDVASGAITDWDPNVAGEVDAIATTPGTVYLGGAFTQVGGAARSNLAAVAPGTGAAGPWNPRVNGTVLTIDPAGPVVRFGGGFDAVNVTAGDFRPRLGAAAVQTDTGIATGFDPGGFGGGTVLAMAHVGARVLLSPPLKAWDDTGATDAGQAAPLAAAPTGGTVQALLADDARVLLGGSFTGVAGAPARRGLAAVDPATGAVLPLDAGLNGDVRALARVGSRLLVGGTFSSAGGAPHGRLAVIGRASGAVDPWDPGLSDPVKRLAGSDEAGAVVLDGAGRLRRIAFPPGAPGAPTAVAAEGAATVRFGAAAPAGAPVTGYTVTATPGGATGGGTGSPITVRGLSPGTAYTFTVTATNAAGVGDPSAATNAVTPSAPVPQPGSGTTPGPGPGPGSGPSGSVRDRTAPTVTGLTVSHKRFKLAQGRTARLVRATRAVRGTTFRFVLSEAARTTIAVARTRSGRRSGTRCVAPRKGLKRRCTRVTNVLTLTRTKARKGANSVMFTGRVAKVALAPGSYRATVRATDAAGNRSTARTVGFTVVR